MLVNSGKREPDVTGSISNSLKYKAWRLDVLMNYSLGASIRLFKVYSNNVSGSGSSSQIYPEYNMNRSVLNRWQKTGDEYRTNIPALISSGNPAYYNYSVHYSSGSYYQGVKLAEDAWSMYDYSDVRVASADYLKIANISLTYELPEKALNSLKIQRLALTLSASNLYTFCNKELKGLTPTQTGFAPIQLSDVPIYNSGVNIQF